MTSLSSCFVAALALCALSGAPALILPASTKWGQRLSTVSTFFGGAFGLYVAMRVLLFGEACAFSARMQLPGMSFAIDIDALSAAFLVPIFVLGPLASLYGLGYWRVTQHSSSGRALCVLHGILMASLALVATAANGILFLMAWEFMALTAYFLITVESEKADVREAGWIYLVAAHVSTVLLFAFFGLYAGTTGTFDLTVDAAHLIPPATASILFVLAVCGFGVKAGLVPFHVWLPPAHANAPSHVSAFLSGVLISMGVYGIARMCWLLPATSAWWAALLIIAGSITSLYGIVSAIVQRDIKRLLACSSIENMGIATMALGLALLGRVLNEPTIAVLGIAGMVWHVWNHALYKGTLFFAAGAVIHATHSRDLNHYGGLNKSMPITASAALVATLAICGLPPLNGFLSELAIYVGLFRSVGDSTHGAAVAGVATVALPALAFTGGLALAAFAKLHGTTFLGEARTAQARHAHDPVSTMRVPMVVLAGACVLIGCAPIIVAAPLDAVASHWFADRHPLLGDVLPLQLLSTISCAILVVTTIVVALFKRRATQTQSERPPTWDCGYVAPSPRMQYTASGFSQILADLFRWAAPRRVTRPEIHELYPEETQFATEPIDITLEHAIHPVVRYALWTFGKLRAVQMGWVQVYLVYILLALLALLVLP